MELTSFSVRGVGYIQCSVGYVAQSAGIWKPTGTVWTWHDLAHPTIIWVFVYDWRQSTVLISVCWRYLLQPVKCQSKFLACWLTTSCSIVDRTSHERMDQYCCIVTVTAGRNAWRTVVASSSRVKKTPSTLTVSAAVTGHIVTREIAGTKNAMYEIAGPENAVKSVTCCWFNYAQ